VEEGVGKEAYVAERLDHLGIVAGVCREIGLAKWLDAQDSQSHERVSVDTATMAMILNGLGFSNRRLYLVPLQNRQNKAAGVLCASTEEVDSGNVLCHSVSPCLTLLPGRA
jgi:Domain of unknown function (DUF4277)